MKTTRPIQVSKVRIDRFSMKGHGEKILERRTDIDSIVKLVQKQGTKCEYFIDSPQLKRFRIELYQDKKVLSRIAVAGNFVKKDNEWYIMQDPSLLRKLIDYTKDVPLVRQACSFG